MKKLFIIWVSFAATCALWSAKSESEEESLKNERRFALVLERAIVDAAEVMLLTIAPHSRYDVQQRGRSYVSVDDMEGSWLITGKAKITDRKAIADLAGSLRRGIAEDREYEAPPCFSPKHAIRFLRGSEEVTVLVCFECLQCYTHRFSERKKFQVSMKSEPIWTAIFTKTGLKIADDKEAD